MGQTNGPLSISNTRWDVDYREVFVSFSLEVSRLYMKETQGLSFSDGLKWERRNYEHRN